MNPRKTDKINPSKKHASNSIYNFLRCVLYPIKLILPHHPVLLKLRDFNIYVHMNDWAVGAGIVLRREYEPHVTNILKSHLKSDDVMVDIGANIGYHTLMAASITDKTGKIIAFEPSTDNCRLLKQSAEKNNFTNIIIHQKAVTDKKQVVGFRMDDSNGAISTVSASSCPMQVESVFLDDVLKNEPRIDVIKIDTEGAEGLVIRGARNIITRHHPAIITEFSPDALKAASQINPETYLDTLRELNYKISVIDRKTRNALPAEDNAGIMRYFTQSQTDHIDLFVI